MVKYNNLVDEVLILNYGEHVEFLDRQLKKMSSNPNSRIEEVLKLTELKFEYYSKYCKALAKFKKLTSEQKLIIDLYIFKNKTCYEVAERLDISVRTFFRKLEDLNNAWNNLSSSESEVQCGKCIERF